MTVLGNYDLMTSDFLKHVVNLDFKYKKYDTCDDDILIDIYDNDKLVLTVSTTVARFLNIRKDFRLIEPHRQYKLLCIVMQYINTPVIFRERIIEL